MLKLASILSSVQPPATLVTAAKARAMRAAGRSVISLNIGEPDFDTPANVKAAAIAAIERGHMGYPPTRGLPELVQAIIGKFERENGLSFAPNEVIVSTGAKHVIANALIATLNPGDEVLVPAPFWASYTEMVTLFGGAPKVLPTDAASGFKLTPAQLHAAIGPRTRWLVLNSPNNPSGSVYSAAELSALADVLLEHPQVLVMSDDIYEHLIYDASGFATMAQVQPRLRERTLTINGVSKAYAMTGWRLGYGAGPAQLIAAMENVQGQLTSGTSVPAQYAAAEALTGDQSFLPGRRESFRERRDLVVAALNEAEGIRCPVPSGAFYVFPSCEGLLGKSTQQGRVMAASTDFADALLEAEGVSVVQGEAFGMAGHFRISYASAEHELVEACQRIQRFCAGLE